MSSFTLDVREHLSAISKKYLHHTLLDNKSFRWVQAISLGYPTV